MNIKEVKNFLLKAKQKNKIHNAYIIYGGNNKLRNESALFLSGILNCREENFCKKCEICKKIEKRTHPDIKWIVPENNILSIDEVRNVKNDIFIKPYFQRYKIYIFQIEYVKEEAGSAFLKVLEEPPEYGIIIILCPNINFLLPTVISRCFKIYINYELPEINKDDFKNIEEFLELLNLVKIENFFEFFKKVDLLNKREERGKIEKWFESVLFYLRDAFLSERKFPLHFFINKDFIRDESFNSLDIQLIEKIWEVKQRIKYNINLKLAIENLIFQISYFSNVNK
ncbi:MAG: hypothetical protein N2589_01955 [bacterium]|nr:hypothetical protein [bacterium]